MPVRASDQMTLTTLASPTYVRPYFRLQASTLAAPPKPTTNPPAAPWTTTEPTYDPGSSSTDTLYIVMLTAYGSQSFEYSDVTVSSTYEAAKSAWNKADIAQTSAATALGLYNTLVVADFTNYFNDPNFEKTGYTTWTRVVTGGKAGIERQGQSAQSGIYNVATAFPVTPGHRYMASAKRSNVFGGTGQASIYFRAHAGANGTGTVVASGKLLALDVAGEPKATYVVPAGVASLSFGFYVESTMPSTTRVRIEDFRLRRMEAGEALVDGSLTALTLTGATLQTATSGDRIVLDDRNRLAIYAPTASQGPSEMVIQPSDYGMKITQVGGGTTDLSIGGGVALGGDYGTGIQSLHLSRRDAFHAILSADVVDARVRLLQGGEPLPYRWAAGATIKPGGVAMNASFAMNITFPPGRFTQPPILTVSSSRSRISVGALTVTTTGASLLLENWSTGNEPADTRITWQAVQMAVDRADG